MNKLFSKIAISSYRKCLIKIPTSVWINEVQEMKMQICTACNSFPLLCIWSTSFRYVTYVTIPQSIYDKMQPQRTHRKTIELSRSRWTKYVTSLLETCQMASINAKQAENNLKVYPQKRQVLQKCQTTFFLPTSLKMTKSMPTYVVPYMPNSIFSCETTLKKPSFWNLALKMPTLLLLVWLTMHVSLVVSHLLFLQWRNNCTST